MPKYQVVFTQDYVVAVEAPDGRRAIDAAEEMVCLEAERFRVMDSVEFQSIKPLAARAKLDAPVNA